ncbi:hypothetical protein AAG906_021399 [Vitis piasezkii]
MADALLSIVLTRLASVVEQQIRDELTLVLGVEAEIQSLTDTLRSVRDVLEDAERRQVKEKSVQGWLEKLKDMAYQMDDVVDEWSTAILQLQIEGAESASMSKKKIKGIKQQLHVIASQRSQFNFISSLSEEPQRFITTSQLDIPEVYGRDMDKNTILGHLLGETCQETKSGPYIISIVGTGGMGKTTLAQQAYNLPEVKAHFDERIWVCVSDPFDPKRIFREIFEILEGKSPGLNSLEALQKKIQELIAGKKFLIVLDDVWTENHQLWGQLKSTLNCGGVGSRILATTRKESVVKMVGTTYTHSLEELSREQARALFHQIAFFEKSRRKQMQGLATRYKNIRESHALKNNKEEWENVLNSEVWQLDEFERDICPALLLSYYDLPPAIKRCFSFCAVFPKDSVIKIDELIRLWMAQNYLNSDASKEMEMVGREYFEYLAARSFFQDFEKDGDDDIIRCKMHDIVHDFAQFLTKNECFIMNVENAEEGRTKTSFQKIRHATLIGQQRYPNFVSTYKMKNLHTLLLKFTFSSTSDEALPNLFQHLTCLRALNLAESFDYGTSKGSRKLIHLKYLSLSDCHKLRELPETICDLYNLQTLNITMGKLINLRHLQNCGALDLKGLPKGIARLNSLQTLEEFVVSSDEGYGKWKMHGGTKAELKNKIHIHHLTLVFDLKDGTKGVAEALHPHPNLKSLCIWGYGDIEWHDWMMRSSLTQLKNLELSHCSGCQCLPPLGELPVLEKLKIKDMESVKHIGGEFLGSSSTIAFPNLKKLTFHNMKEWEKWEIKKKKKREMPKAGGTTRPCPPLDTVAGISSQILIFYNNATNRILRGWTKVSHIPKVIYGGSNSISNIAFPSFPLYP